MLSAVIYACIASTASPAPAKRRRRVAASVLLLQLELVPALLDLGRMLDPPLAVGEPLDLLVLAVGRELVQFVLGQQLLEIRAWAGIGDVLGDARLLGCHRLVMEPLPEQLLLVLRGALRDDEPGHVDLAVLPVDLDALLPDDAA